MKTITLRYPASCRDCGRSLPAGVRANFHGRGKVSCCDCATQPVGRIREDRDEPLGQTLSRLDPYGLYSIDGRKLGSSCRCEDYPCCGH